jgi:hypothetical protein
VSGQVLHVLRASWELTALGAPSSAQIRSQSWFSAEWQSHCHWDSDTLQVSLSPDHLTPLLRQVLHKEGPGSTLQPQG